MTRFLLKVNEPLNFAFVFEVDGLVAGFTIGDVLHINKGLELNVRLRLESVQVQFVGLAKAFTSYLDEVVVITLLVSFKLDIKLYSEACSNTTDVLEIATEVRSSGLGKLEAAHVLGYVSNGNGHFIVLVWLNI